MFAPDAQFYGTLSPQLVVTSEGVHRYFIAALERQDVFLATPLQMSAQALSETVVLIAGLWKLEVLVVRHKIRKEFGEGGFSVRRRPGAGGSGNRDCKSRAQ
jgi:hypothetical protein